MKLQLASGTKTHRSNDVRIGPRFQHYYLRLIIIDKSPRVSQAISVDLGQGTRSVDERIVLRNAVSCALRYVIDIDSEHLAVRLSHIRSSIVRHKVFSERDAVTDRDVKVTVFTKNRRATIVNETGLGELEVVDFCFRENSCSGGICGKSGDHNVVRAVVPLDVDVTVVSKVRMEGKAMKTVLSGFRVRL